LQPYSVPDPQDRENEARRVKVVWSIKERDGIYTIAPYKNAMGHKGWVVDTERAESLPSGATIEEVIKRTIERVQALEGK
jgi:hypothetical protein